MSHGKTGGSAFPITETNGANSGDVGMTVHDYATIHFMAAILSNPQEPERSRHDRLRVATAHADAFIAARIK